MICEYCSEGDSKEKGIVYEYSDPPWRISHYLHKGCVDHWIDERTLV